MTNSILVIIFTTNPAFTKNRKTITRGTAQNVFLIRKFCHTMFKAEPPLPEWATAVEHSTSNS